METSKLPHFHIVMKGKLKYQSRQITVSAKGCADLWHISQLAEQEPNPPVSAG